MHVTELRYGYVAPLSDLENLARNERKIYYAGHLAMDRSVIHGASLVGTTALKKYEKGLITLVQKKVLGEVRTERGVIKSEYYEYIAIGL